MEKILLVQTSKKTSPFITKSLTPSELNFIHASEMQKKSYLNDAEVNKEISHDTKDESSKKLEPQISDNWNLLNTDFSVNTNKKKHKWWNLLAKNKKDMISCVSVSPQNGFKSEDFVDIVKNDIKNKNFLFDLDNLKNLIKNYEEKITSLRNESVEKNHQLKNYVKQEKIYTNKIDYLNTNINKLLTREKTCFATLTEHKKYSNIHKSKLDKVLTNDLEIKNLMNFIFQQESELEKIYMKKLILQAELERLKKNSSIKNNVFEEKKNSESSQNQQVEELFARIRDATNKINEYRINEQKKTDLLVKKKSEIEQLRKQLDDFKILARKLGKIVQKELVEKSINSNYQNENDYIYNLCHKNIEKLDFLLENKSHEMNQDQFKKNFANIFSNILTNKFLINEPDKRRVVKAVNTDVNLNYQIKSVKKKKNAKYSKKLNLPNDFYHIKLAKPNDIVLSANNIPQNLAQDFLVKWNNDALKKTKTIKKTLDTPSTTFFDVNIHNVSDDDFINNCEKSGSPKKNSYGKFFNQNNNSDFKLIKLNSNKLNNEKQYNLNEIDEKSINQDKLFDDKRETPKTAITVFNNESNFNDTSYLSKNVSEFPKSINLDDLDDNQDLTHSSVMENSNDGFEIYNKSNFKSAKNIYKEQQFKKSNIIPLQNNINIVSAKCNLDSGNSNFLRAKIVDESIDPNYEYQKKKIIENILT